MHAVPHIPLSPADGLPMPRRLGAILAVAFGVSLSVIDGTIANVALPTIGQQLGISAADSIWIVNAYQLAIMVSLLSLSALGDVVGYRKVYIGGLMLFTVASVGCSLSGSLQTLVPARVMQGFGAAAITSVNTTLIRFIYPKARLGRGMGINATVVATSSVAGPTLAAEFSVADWPWLFAVNVPIGLAALALSRRFLPENPVRVRDHRFDWRDAVMNALTFGLMMASVEGFSHGLDPRVLSLGARRSSSSASSSSAASCANPTRFCRSTCCASRSSRCRSQRRSARSSGRCSPWWRCPSTCNRPADTTTSRRGCC